MTTEEKAKAYDEALARANELYNRGYTSIPVDIFPELAESEDEKIRKRLITDFGTIGKKEWGGLEVKDILAWLEKQNPVVVPKFRIGDTIRHKSGDDTSYTIVDIVNDSYICENNHSWRISSQDYFELVEQKPVWTEEDENMLNNCIAAIVHPDCFSYSFRDEAEVWLKSLKGRMQKGK